MSSTDTPVTAKAETIVITGNIHMQHVICRGMKSARMQYAGMHVTATTAATRSISFLFLTEMKKGMTAKLTSFRREPFRVFRKTILYMTGITALNSVSIMTTGTIFPLNSCLLHPITVLTDIVRKIMRSAAHTKQEKYSRMSNFPIEVL